MSDTQNATPAEMLERHITDPCIPKSEAEWWAHREIERLRAALRDALDSLRYWVPQTSVGAIERCKIVEKGIEALEAKP